MENTSDYTSIYTFPLGTRITWIPFTWGPWSHQNASHETHLSGLGSCGGETDDAEVVGTADPEGGLEEWEEWLPKLLYLKSAEDWVGGRGGGGEVHREMSTSQQTSTSKLSSFLQEKQA